MTHRGQAVVAIAAEHQLAITTAQQLMAAARQRADALSSEISDARGRLAESLALLRRSTAAMAWPFTSSIAADADVATATQGRTFAAVTELIERVERATGGDADALDRILADIKAAIWSDADPCLLLGLLLEGIVQTLTQRVPATAQSNMALALVELLCDRVNLRAIDLE